MPKDAHLKPLEPGHHIWVVEQFLQLKSVFRQGDVVCERVPFFQAAREVAITDLSSTVSS